MWRLVWSARHGNSMQILGQMVDRNGRIIPKEHKVLIAMASYESMESRCELTRGIMTLPQTEMWHFITSEPMRALRKPLIHFPQSTTASQCIGPLDVPPPR